MDRRDFLRLLATAALAAWPAEASARTMLEKMSAAMSQSHKQSPATSHAITMFLCGDVMTGRGIDQVLPQPGDPRIHESYMKSAIGYVGLAEQANGPIPKPVDFSYIWGEALEEMERLAPDVRIINLETAVTTSDDYWQGKGINYRMHPANIPCLTAAKIDACALANNHVLDWGHAGLAETLETLKKADVEPAGAGRNLKEAEAPAVMELAGKGRVIVFSFGAESSGITRDWAAAADSPGVNLLPDLSDRTVRRIAGLVHDVKQDRDIVVASIHWGENWGYRISSEQTAFAHRLIDEAGANVIHGHSSHHPKGIEVYNDRPVIYGCGDFINDYEGIGGYEEYRPDLALMYFVSMDPSTGRLVRFDLTPTQIKRFQVRRASKQDAQWLRDTLNREGGALGTRLELKRDTTLNLRWERG